MSAQARLSNPAMLNWRDSKLGIPLMNHADPGLQCKIAHVSHFSVDWKSWPQNARSCKRMGFFFFFLNYSYYFGCQELLLLQICEWRDDWEQELRAMD